MKRKSSNYVIKSVINKDIFNNNNIIYNNNNIYENK